VHWRAQSEEGCGDQIWASGLEQQCQLAAVWERQASQGRVKLEVGEHPVWPLGRMRLFERQSPLRDGGRKARQHASGCAAASDATEG
jgi:hypothetical protein